MFVILGNILEKKDKQDGNQIKVFFFGIAPMSLDI